jgi:adenylate kinase
MLNEKETKMDVILLGGPGSGKGTQAELLQERLGFTHVASGDLFRENINNQTELGLLAKGYIDQGQLVPDEVTISMIQSRLQKPDVEDGILFDGFPRTIPQAEALEKLLAEFHRKIDVVINLSVSEDEIVRRLSGRLICRECQIPFHREFNPFKECPLGKCHGEFLYQREDDKPETVRERLEVFNRQTAPLIAFFQERGNLITVSGEGTLESINNRIIDALQLEN